MSSPAFGENTTPSQAGEIRFSDHYVFYVLMLLSLTNVMNYGQRMALSVLLPYIKADIDLSDTQLGLLLGGAFAISYSAASVPLARLADRSVRRTFIAYALAFWSSITALMGLSQNFVHLFFARIGLGIGEAACIPCSHSILADYVPLNKRPFALALHSCGAVVGVSISLLVAGALASAYGWRAALLLIALPGFGLAIVIRLTMSEPPRGFSDGHVQAPAAPLPHAVRYLLANKAYLLLLAAVCIAMLVEFGLSQWLPTFYVRRFGLSPEVVGLRLGIIVAASGVTGTLLGGLVANRLVRKDPRWMMWMPGACYAIALPLGICMFTATHASVSFGLNAAYIFLIYATNGPIWAALFAIVPPNMRATTSALTLLVAGVCGLAIGPVLVGGLSDLFASAMGENSLKYSLLVVQSLAIIVIVALMAASLFSKPIDNRADALSQKQGN